jgi:hypothetical protein
MEDDDETLCNSSTTTTSFQDKSESLTTDTQLLPISLAVDNESSSILFTDHHQIFVDDDASPLYHPSLLSIVNSNKPTFKCNRCDKYYTRKYYLHRHQRHKHNIAGQYRCKMCTNNHQCTYQTPIGLRQHLLRIHHRSDAAMTIATDANVKTIMQQQLITERRQTIDTHLSLPTAQLMQQPMVYATTTDTRQFTTTNPVCLCTLFSVQDTRTLSNCTG